MAAAKSSLNHPKLLMCMRARQHPSHTPEGTEARAAPLSRSAGATCCSPSSARNVAGMKVPSQPVCSESQSQRTAKLKGSNLQGQLDLTGYISFQ